MYQILNKYIILYIITKLTVTDTYIFQQYFVNIQLYHACYFIPTLIKFQKLLFYLQFIKNIESLDGSIFSKFKSINQ